VRARDPDRRGRERVRPGRPAAVARLGEGGRGPVRDRLRDAEPDGDGHPRALGRCRGHRREASRERELHDAPLRWRRRPCTLDFSGQLLRDASARIDAGLGSVDITVPALTPARVVTKAFASARRSSGGFVSQGDTYYTRPGLQGAHPLLDIEVWLAFGAADARP